MKKIIVTIGLLIVLATTLCGCSNDSSQKTKTTVHSSEYFEEMVSYDRHGNVSQRIVTNKKTNGSYIYTYYYIYENGFFLLSKTDIATIDETGTITVMEEE